MMSRFTATCYHVRPWYYRGMARVLLVNAGWGPLFSGRVRRYNRAFPPLDLLNCAALLRAGGAHVDVADARVDPRALDAIALDGYDTIAVTLSSLDRWQCPNTDLDHAAAFLARFPSDRLAVLGAQGTIEPEVVLRRTGARCLVRGEPEGPLVALVDGGRPGEVAGTACLESGALRMAPRGREIELTDLPIPAFDRVDFSRYRYEVLGERLGLLELTRGCPWRCKFCLLEMYGKRYRKKTPAQAMAEIEHAWALGMRCAYFQDLEFTLDRPLVEGLCDALRTSGLPLRWACQTRPDTVDRALLRTMRAAGCVLIHFGVESGVQRIVDSTEKGLRLEAVERAVADAHDVGMRTLCYFLLGLPTETLEDMHATLRFAQRVRPTYASFMAATPYAGTPFYAEHTFADPFPVAFEGPLTPAALRKLARDLTARYHLSPRYLWERLSRPGRASAAREVGLLASYLFS